MRLRSTYFCVIAARHTFPCADRIVCFNRCYKNVFYLITLVYPRCAQTCLQLFASRKLDIGTYLAADYNIVVRTMDGHWGHRYVKYIPAGIGLLVVFAIGVPAFYLYTMYKIRNRLDVSS